MTKETGKYLTPSNPRTARFYHLPKLHKPGNPGRPIVSSCRAPTKRISEFADYHLQPLVKQLPSYLRDTKDFLWRISNLDPLPPDCILLTLDVSSLYTNIPHNEGIEACRRALDTHANPDPPTDSLVRMMEQILTLNNFKFNGQHYLQIQETAMGTRMAPSYANIFMGELEKHLLQNTVNRPSIWWRYIEDIFAVWNDGEEQLQHFLQEINTFHPTIKFTAEWSREKVSFLDTTVILDGTILGVEGGLLVKALDCGSKGPGFQSHLQQRFISLLGALSPTPKMFTFVSFGGDIKPSVPGNPIILA